MLYYYELITLDYSSGVLFFKPGNQDYLKSLVDQLTDSDYMGKYNSMNLQSFSQRSFR